MKTMSETENKVAPVAPETQPQQQAPNKDQEVMQLVQSFASKLNTANLLNQEVMATAKQMLDTILPLMGEKTRELESLRAKVKEQSEMIVRLSPKKVKA